MGVIKGDFLGFTYNGIHSSELGIFRVSDGNRYTENLFPTIQDKTTQRPGADGTYYYGSFYTQKSFNISIAYEDLSDEQLRRIKNLFSDKNPHDLIFDEAPYKVYKVKITGTPNLKYVCFDKPLINDYRDKENDTGFKSKEQLYEVGAKVTTGRVYKGEGQLSFIAYNPFARCRYKYLDQYVFKNIPEWGSMDNNNANDVYYNLYDWVEASRLVPSSSKKKKDGKTYSIDEVTKEGLMYYNAGDKEVPFCLNFMFDRYFNGCTISNNEFLIQLEDFLLVDGDKGIKINSNLHLIEGIDENGAPTGTIYNKYIIKGDFFKFPVTDELTWLGFSWGLDGDEAPPSNFKGSIEYKYIYY